MNILILNFILSTAVDGRILRRESNHDTMIHAMARGFVKRGHRVTLAAAADFKPFEDEKNTGFEIVYFKSRLPKIFKPSLLPWPKGLGKYLRANAARFDMILSVDTFSFPTIIAARNAHDKLLVWQEMAFMQHMMGGLPAKIWYNLIAPRFVRNAPVVTQSENARMFIARYLPNISDEIIGHGSDSDLFYPAEQTDEYFVVISMLVARKQIDRIIQKFSRFLSNTPYKNYKLRIIGEGPEMGHLKTTAADCGIADSVSFEGFMDHKTIADIGRRAKALLIDTRQDNNMVTIPESIVNGTPVLTNMVPNNAVFVRDLGLGIACKSWDWEELVQMVERNDEFRANCIAHRHRFSNEGCAEALLDVFTREKNLHLET